MRQNSHLMTYVLIALFVLVFLGEWVFQIQASGFALGISGENLYRLGGNYSLAISEGEYWRLLSACFLHLDPMHLGMNSLAMYYFGPFLERSFGPWKLLLAFVATGIAGSLLTFLIHVNEPYLSAGASGGLYGLFGVMFVSGKRYKSYLPPSFQIWLNQTLAILVIFSFAPFIDMWGHFGGLMAGFMLGWWYKPQVMQTRSDGSLQEEISQENI